MGFSSIALRASLVSMLLGIAWHTSATPVQAAAPAAALPPVLGAQPAAEIMPKVEFVFEERVTLSPPVVLGETPFGRRQYIGITGGTVAGPKLKGEVVPGGWDYQLKLNDGCGTLSADYFLRADDGTLIHIVNEAYSCGPNAVTGERFFFRPKFEAPKGPHEWLNRSSFVALLEVEPPVAATAGGSPPTMAIRIKFFQVK